VATDLHWGADAASLAETLRHIETERTAGPFTGESELTAIADEAWIIGGS
jgi:hypothetical protein